jgi:hypothetical protein
LPVVWIIFLGKYAEKTFANGGLSIAKVCLNVDVIFWKTSHGFSNQALTLFLVKHFED